MPSKYERKWNPYLVDGSIYPKREYRCGLFVGDEVIQRRELIIEDPDVEDGHVSPEGARWTVRHPVPGCPFLVWLENDDGLTISWDDGGTLLRFFKVVKRHDGHLPKPEDAE